MLVPPNFCTIHRREATESAEWLYFVKPFGMDFGVSIGGLMGIALVGVVKGQVGCQPGLERYCHTVRGIVWDWII